MQKSDRERLGWTEICCICGRCIVCFDNPDPLRDGDGGNCCPACNRLVIAARRKIGELPGGEGAAYAQMLRDLPHETLERLLLPS
ncbi:MAG: hypothetical protein IKV90_10120 [Clostridia bacterium]|nr:hypothetical protein [Clostridia bacterium]